MAKNVTYFMDGPQGDFGFGTSLFFSALKIETSQRSVPTDFPNERPIYFRRNCMAFTETVLNVSLKKNK